MCVEKSRSHPAQQPRGQKTKKERPHAKNKLDIPFLVTVNRWLKYHKEEKPTYSCSSPPFYSSIYRSRGSVRQSFTKHSALEPKVYFGQGPYFLRAARNILVGVPMQMREGISRTRIDNAYYEEGKTIATESEKSFFALQRSFLFSHSPPVRRGPVFTYFMNTSALF